jgi:hypothetical protein
MPDVGGGESGCAYRGQALFDAAGMSKLIDYVDEGHVA